MPRELRKIVFSAEEVQAAAVGHCLHAKIPLPQANITQIDIAEDPLATVVLHFSPSNPAEPTEVALTREEVAAALIRRCVEQHIPLPRQAQKLLHTEEDGIALMINIDHAAEGKGKKRA